MTEAASYDRLCQRLVEARAYFPIVSQIYYTIDNSCHSFILVFELYEIYELKILLTFIITIHLNITFTNNAVKKMIGDCLGIDHSSK